MDTIKGAGGTAARGRPALGLCRATAPTRADSRTADPTPGAAAQRPPRGTSLHPPASTKASGLESHSGETAPHLGLGTPASEGPHHRRRGPSRDAELKRPPVRTFDCKTRSSPRPAPAQAVLASDTRDLLAARPGPVRLPCSHCASAGRTQNGQLGAPSRWPRHTLPRSPGTGTGDGQSAPWHGSS